MKAKDKQKLSEDVFNWLRTKKCKIDVVEEINGRFSSKVKKILGLKHYVTCIEMTEDGKPYNTIFVAYIGNAGTYKVDVIKQFIKKSLLVDYFDRMGIQHADSWEEFALKFSLVAGV